MRNYWKLQAIYNQRSGGILAAASSLEGGGQESLDLVGGRGIAFEEVAALGDEGRAGQGWCVYGRGQGRELGGIFSGT